MNLLWKGEFFLPRISSFILSYARRKAAAAGTSGLKRYAPEVLRPLTPLFWLRHPLKAIYFWLFWKVLRFAWTLLNRYFRK